MRDKFLPISNLSDYQQLFNLTPEDLGKKILDFPAGLNSFSAEMLEQHHTAVACDEMYTDPVRLKQLGKTISAHENHQATLQKFTEDFQPGIQQNRYINGALPTLPFSYHEFDLLLCSFFFFFNGDDLANYWDNLIEMLRVATEVRIAPLVSTQNLEQLLGPLMLKLQAHSFGIEVRSINSSDLPASAMLRVWSQHCQIT